MPVEAVQGQPVKKRPRDIGDQSRERGPSESGGDVNAKDLNFIDHAVATFVSPIPGKRLQRMPMTASIA